MLRFLDAYLRIYKTSIDSYITLDSLSYRYILNYDTTKYIFDIGLRKYFGDSVYYENGDSVYFISKYVVCDNTEMIVVDGIGGLMETESYFNIFLNDDSLINNIYGCNSFFGRISYIPYYYYMGSTAGNYVSYDCDNLTLSRTYFFGVGPCCQNYEGGNLFPYEYRYLSNIEERGIVIPRSYKYKSARFNQTRTAGSAGSVKSEWINIVPYKIVGDTYYFNVQQYFDNKMLPKSDEGYRGTFEVQIQGGVYEFGDSLVRMITYISTVK
jgi:hypothetical protein